MFEQNQPGWFHDPQYIATQAWTDVERIITVPSLLFYNGAILPESRSHEES